MASWPEKREVIGTNVQRVDAPAKVSGTAKYCSDVQPEGWLYGMIFRAPWPAAKVTKINLDKARQMPGIKAVVTVAEGETTVRFYGQELAAVAGTSKLACLDALKTIEVEATLLPFVVKEEDAIKDSSPRVWPDAANLAQARVNQRGDDVDKLFGSAAAVVEGALAARLSQAAGAPVKIMLTRFDQSLAVGNRPSTFQKVKLAADADGKLVAFEMDSFGTAGIGAGSASAGGGGGAGFPAPYIYRVPNVRVKQAGVAINAGPARAMRAPGNPPASFGMESIMDELAVKLGMDPVELRMKNDASEVRQREYKIGVERFGWKDKYKKPGTSPGMVKTGIGCGSSQWGGGGRGTQAEVQIHSDGSVEVRCGTQDLGTGTKTLMAIIAAEIFGLKPEQIVPRVGDTQFPPSGGSGGSTTAASVSPAIFDACTNALHELQTRTGVADARGGNWRAACKKLGVNPLVVHGQWQQGLSSSGSGGVQFAEVEVDTETGFIKVKKILAVQDCGLIISKLTCESQINGGIMMGIGFALYEERIMDRGTGMVLNPNFETYKLPGIADTPEIEIVLLDMPERGVIGIGEPATIPTASAIANAVANAIGVRITSLPITPAKVLAALGKVKQTGAAA